MNDSRPRFGLIGTGVWVREVQAPAAAASDQVRLTAIHGRNDAAATAIAAAHGVRAEPELQRFFEQVDIVGIALPPEAQPDFALAAIAAGKHLLLEKPLATDAAAAAAIVAGLREQGLQSLVFFTQLLNPRVLAWLAEAEATGGWRGGRIDSFSNVLVDPANPFHLTRWRGARGALWDTAPHAVALLTRIFGRVTTLAASAGPGDLKSLLLTHAGGGLSTINLAMDLPATVAGEIAIFGDAGKRILAPAKDGHAEARRAYGEALAALTRAMAGEPSPHPDAEFGAYVTRVLLAAERALAEGGRLIVD